jgi:TRAP-type uncharacterized transport system fused permease subunit
VGLAAAGFIVPFIFVYGPPLLMVGSAAEIVLAALTGTIGVIALAAAIMGYARRPLALWERFALGAGSLLMIIPGLMTDVAGLAVALFFFSRTVQRPRPQAAATDDVRLVAADTSDATR